MSSTKPRKAIAYIRVSRVSGREGDSFISPEVQRERIDAIAKASGLRIVGEYVDLDQSGKKENRPGFQSALADVEAGRASAIVVARLSRFARSVMHVERALQRLEEHDGVLIAGDLNVDTTTPQGRLMRTILAAIAQFEVEVHSENWVDAKAHALARGVKLSGVCPVGYRWRDEDDHRLVVDPVYGPIVVELFSRRSAGHSWTALREFWCDATGERISRPGLTAIVANRVYLGEVTYGGETKHGAHDALVTVEQFESAQARNVHAPRPARGPGSLLAGILRCGSCGGPMSSGSTGRKHGTTYRCYRDQCAGEPCPAPMSVLAKVADPVVEARFLEWAKGKAKIEGTSRSLADLEAALDVLAKAEAEMVAFTTATSASANPELFSAGLAARELAVEEARERVDAIRLSGKVETVRTDALGVWHDPTTSIEDKRRILKAAIERVTVHLPEGRSTARGVPFESRSEVVFRD